ncbi:MAG: dgkA [Chloroflexi bacterium]|nr:dgkA [Chloroflexota bacterium]
MDVTPIVSRRPSARSTGVFSGRARSLGHAIDGVKYAARSQPNARVHCAVGVFASALGVWLGLSSAELALLVLTIGLVLALEAMNTAIESAVDAIQRPPSVAAKCAKDCAAAAVLIGAVASMVVGGILFVPRLAALIFSLA